MEIPIKEDGVNSGLRGDIPRLVDESGSEDSDQDDVEQAR